MIVFDDYAENIQKNQEKTAIFARDFPGFFGSGRPKPGISRRIAACGPAASSDGDPLPARLERHRNRPVAEIIATWKPGSRIGLGTASRLAKSLNERCM